MTTEQQAYALLTKHSSKTAYRFKFGMVGQEYQWGGRLHNEAVVSKDWVCHFPLHDWHNPKFLWSVYPRRNKPKKEPFDRAPSGKHPTPDGVDFPSERPYLAWLVSAKWSPWKTVLPKKPIVIDGVNAWGFEQIWNHGFFWNRENLDVPANALVNFLIASRTPYEWNWIPDLWYKLVLDGIHPSIANWFATMVNPQKDGKYALYDNQSHIPIYAGSSDSNTFERFVRSQMNQQYFTQSACMSLKYSPCNAIWGNGRGIPYGKFLLQLYPKIWEAAQKTGGQKRQRIFGYKPNDPGVNEFGTVPITYDVLLALASLEQKRLNMEFDLGKFRKEVLRPVETIRSRAKRSLLRSGKKNVLHEWLQDDIEPITGRYRGLDGRYRRKSNAIRGAKIGRLRRA